MSVEGKEGISVTAEQDRKFNSCDVLCTVLGVHFPNECYL